jgi:RNA polymerase sigma factor (sigma-70 family)
LQPLIYNEKYDSYTDLELIENYAKSSNNVFVGLLYKRYGHLVLGLCMKYLKNKPEAQDATVQIFANLLKDLKKHRIAYFKSWLYVYTKNFCLMELRKRQSALKKELELNENAHLLMDSPDPEHLKEKERQIILMEEALQLLNTEQRVCIELFYLKNKSYNEIVEETGYSPNDVKSYIQNGKRNLKIRMEALMNEQEKK